MGSDCHIHMVLDGVDWKAAIGRHENAVDKAWVRQTLRHYASLGYTYLRDGGDRWGVGAYARQIAPEYGITYRTPLAPLSKKGHYGGFIGLQFEDLKEYAALVQQQKQQGADFIKIMISGLMDFDRYGVLTQAGLDSETIGEMIRIAHSEGMAVMAHCNGARTMEAAAENLVDSIEHGAYADRAALEMMKEAGTVWVPTLSTVGNLRGRGRFDEKAVGKILENTAKNVAEFCQMGGLVAPGTDAGAWSVPHGSDTELPLLAAAGVPGPVLRTATQIIQYKFRPGSAR